MKSTKLRAIKKSELYSDDDELILNALRCLESRLKYENDLPLNSSMKVRHYLQLQLALEKSEVFGVMFMNANFQLISFDKMFYGTIHESVVYPRRFLQKALEYNAAKIIIAHNHPSNNCRPSEADKKLTKELSTILGFIDLKVIDHVIVTATDTFSFSEHQLI